MPKSDRVLLRVGDRMVGDVYSIEWPAKVKTVDGRWLWVEDDGGTARAFVGGWIRADDVLPFNQGPAFYDSRLVAESSSSGSYWLRGICWEHAREYGLAVKDYQSALALNPSNRVARLGLARTLAGGHEYDEQAFREAERANASSPRLYLAWGEALELAKNYDRAENMFERAVRLNPNWPMPHYALGKLAARRENYAEALARYEDAIQRDPSYHAVHRDRATAWLASKKRTYEEMQKTLASREGLAAWLKATEEDGTTALALSAARTACELCFFRDAESLAVLAQAFAALGHWPEAQRFQKMAIEYAPFHVKPTHIERYFAYFDVAKKALPQGPMFASNELQGRPVERSQTIGGSPKVGGRVTESVAAAPSGKMSEEPTAESLPPPTAKSPARRPFVDRSWMRFE